eukprot:Gb_28361 [translate_table: standard]
MLGGFIEVIQVGFIAASCMIEVASFSAFIRNSWMEKQSRISREGYPFPERETLYEIVIVAKNGKWSPYEFERGKGSKRASPLNMDEEIGVEVRPNGTARSASAACVLGRRPVTPALLLFSGREQNHTASGPFPYQFLPAPLSSLRFWERSSLSLTRDS